MTARDLCLIYKTIYERIRKENYALLGRDFKEAKILLELNPDFDEEGIEPHVLQYFKTRNEFIIVKKHPAWILWLQYNEHAPAKIVKKIVPQLTEQSWWCEECTDYHKANEMCPKIHSPQPKLSM